MYTTVASRIFEAGLIRPLKDQLMSSMVLFFFLSLLILQIWVHLRT